MDRSAHPLPPSKYYFLRDFVVPPLPDNLDYDTYPIWFHPPQPHPTERGDHGQDHQTFKTFHFLINGMVPTLVTFFCY